MEFVLFGNAVSLMPGKAWRQFSEICRLGDVFWRKMNVVEILSRESIRSTGGGILQNNPEPLAKLWILHAKLHYKWKSDTLGREILIEALSILTRAVYEYVWDIKILCLTVVVCCCLKRNVRRRRYYLCVWFPVEPVVLRCVWTASLWIIAVKDVCKFQKLLLINLLPFERLFHWLSTTWNTKIVTNFIGR